MTPEQKQEIRQRYRDGYHQTTLEIDGFIPAREDVGLLLDALDAQQHQIAGARTVLDAMNEWLSNSDGLTIEDVIEWRNYLVAALGLKSNENDWTVK